MTNVLSIREDILAYLNICEGKRSAYRDMIRNLHPERYGTTLWEEAFKGLVNSKQIGIIGLGVKTSPKIVFLIQGESFNTTEVTAAVLSQTPTLEKLLTGHLAMLRDQYLHSLRPL